MSTDRSNLGRVEKLDQLIDGAEELLTQLTDAHDPHIQALRDRVDRAIHGAREAIERDNETETVGLRELARTVDDYVRDYPWLALATGIMVAGSVAFIAGAARPRRG